MPPDDDIFAVVNFCARFVIQLVLTDFSGRGALGKYFERLQVGLGNPGSQGTLPEFPNGVRTTDGWAARR